MSLSKPKITVNMWILLDHCVSLLVAGKVSETGGTPTDDGLQVLNILRCGGKSLGCCSIHWSFIVRWTDRNARILSFTTFEWSGLSSGEHSMHSGFSLEGHNNIALVDLLHHLPYLLWYWLCSLIVAVRLNRELQLYCGLRLQNTNQSQSA